MAYYLQVRHAAELSHTLSQSSFASTPVSRSCIMLHAMLAMPPWQVLRRCVACTSMKGALHVAQQNRFVIHRASRARRGSCSSRCASMVV